MSKAHELEFLLGQAGVTLNDAARATVAEFLERGAHTAFDGQQTDETLKARVDEVFTKGDSATVRDLRNVLKYYRTKRGSAFGVIGVGVTYNPTQPDEEAIITLVTGGRKTFRGTQVSKHYRMHGISFALQALAKEHIVMRGNTGMPTSVKFGADGSISAQPPDAQTVTLTDVGVLPKEEPHE